MFVKGGETRRRSAGPMHGVSTLGLGGDLASTTEGKKNNFML